MQKIHRRKNQEIPKDFVCAEGCGKAYGSYAALYTHMKNKHGYMKSNDVKIPQSKIKATGKKGRPMTKVKEEVIFGDPIVSENVCKLCYQSQCICDSSMNQLEVEKALAILSDKAYLKLLNCIGQLNLGENFTWIRSTEEDYQIIPQDKLKQMVEQFNLKNNFTSEVHLSDRWIEYLSQLSRYLDKRYQQQLLEGILLIVCTKSSEKFNYFRSGHEELLHLKRCSEEKKKEWKQFLEVVLMI